jgi:NAD(P)-dependent dehydrogenase (short-subunit alcohol dehydrogenase family)
MHLLENKVVIITGASSGIGRSAALLFSQHGAKLVLVARGKSALSDVVRSITEKGGCAIACPGDVSTPLVHRLSVELALDHFGRLDAAFNNAGVVGPTKPLIELSEEDWSSVIDTNLTAAFLAAKHQIPAMLNSAGGALAFTSSFVGSSVGLPQMGAYGTAKAGLTGLVKSITADYADAGIRANALMPGGVNTAMAGDQASKDFAASLHPIGRIAEPDEIAQAALFLLSDMASFVWGSELWADGGNSATKLLS